MKKDIIKRLFEDNYIYSPIIYNLLKENKLDYYIDQLEIYSLSKNIPDDAKIERYKQFLMFIDQFIDFLYCSLNITNVQLTQILSLIFKDLKDPIFLSEYSIKDNKLIHIITNEYKKIILAPFRKNLLFIKEKVEYKLKFNINDDRLLFNFLIDLCNTRKNHQYLLFDDFNEYKSIPGKLEYYILMWEIVIKKTEDIYCL